MSIDIVVELLESSVIEGREHRSLSSLVDLLRSDGLRAQTEHASHGLTLSPCLIGSRRALDGARLFHQTRV